MKEIIWNKLNGFKKIIFVLGWLAVLNLGFWIALIIHNNLVDGNAFWNPKSFRVVYVFGWINLILILIGLIVEVA